MSQNICLKKPCTILVLENQQTHLGQIGNHYTMISDHLEQINPINFNKNYSFNF